MEESAAGTAARVEEGHRRNGDDPAARDAIPGTGLLRRLARPLVDEVRGRLAADLDDRDPDYIRENLPTAWLLSTLWFRGEVRGVGRIPEDRPVLLVGNHSGGNLTPDTIVFTLAF